MFFTLRLGVEFNVCLTDMESQIVAPSYTTYWLHLAHKQ